MTDDDRRRLEALERKVDNGFFVRKETYEADQRAQERTDLAQERRFSDIKDQYDDLARRMEAGFAEAREDRQWLRRQFITMAFTVLVTAAIAALAMRAVAG